MSVGRGMSPLTLPGVGTKEKEIKDKGLEYKQEGADGFPKMQNLWRVPRQTRRQGYREDGRMSGKSQAP